MAIGELRNYQQDACERHREQEQWAT